MNRPCSSLLIAAATAGLLTPSGASGAAPFNDTSVDLSNTFLTPTALPFSVFNGVEGSLNNDVSPSDLVDSFSLLGLLAGSNLQLDAEWSDTSVGIPSTSFRIQFFDSSNASLPGVSSITSGTSDSAVRNLTVPGDGIVRMRPSSEGQESGSWSYTLNFTGTPIPEPATHATGAGVALAALLALRRGRPTK